MSDRVERAVESVANGQNITRPVNTEMSRDEQLQFARRLWENGTNPRSSAPGVWTRDIDGGQVTFRTVNGERQVSDIVVNGRDIYDTPQETASRQEREQLQRQRAGSPRPSIGDDDRYRGAAAPAEDPTLASRRADYQRCVDGSSRRKVDEAECGAVHAYDPPGIRRTAVIERQASPKVRDFTLPDLELVDNKKPV